MFVDRAFHIERDDADLYVEVVGRSDAPTVLFLHGGPGYNSFSFRDLAGDDLEALRMIYADQRGSGRSYAGAPFDLDTLADDVRVILDALPADADDASAAAAPVLLAHGFGALVAIRAAQAMPERIGRLLLVNPWASMPMLARTLQRASAARAGREDEALPPEAALAEPDALDPERLVDQAFELSAAKPLLDALQFPSPSSRLRLEHSDAEAAFGPGNMAEPTDLWSLDALPELGELDVPIVVLAGTADRTSYPDQITAILERRDDALVSLLDSGHYPWIDAPEDFARLVDEVVGLGGGAAAAASASGASEAAS